MGHSKSNRDFNQQLPYKLIRSKVWESSKNLASRSLRYSYDMSNLCFLHIEVYVICLCHDHMTTLWDNEGSTTSLISLSVMQKERSVEGISFLQTQIPYQNDFSRMDKTSIMWVAEEQQLFGVHLIFQAEFLDLFLAVTVLSLSLVHVPISEHAPLLEYRRTQKLTVIYII